MARLRHPKERWSPTAELVFTKKLRIGDDPKKPFVLPGDPVTPALRKQLGIHRLRKWWDGEFVRMAPAVAPAPKAPKAPQKPSPVVEVPEAVLVPDVAPEAAQEPTPATPAKRGRGRPPGVKNKPKA